VLAHVVGERKQPSANKLIKQVKQKVAGTPSFCSDGLKFYRNALLKFYGHIISFPRTGLRGRPRMPTPVPDENLRYAQVIKHHRNGHLVKVEKRQIFGEDAGRASISTTFIERCNLTIRQEKQAIDEEDAWFLQASVSSGRAYGVLLRQLQFLPTAWLAEASGCLGEDEEMDADEGAWHHRSELEPERAIDLSLS